MTKTLFAATAALGMAASANAALTFVGVDTTAGANWRTNAALEADNEYGTDGYLLFGLHSTDGAYQNSYPSPATHAETVGAMPSTLTLSSTGTTAMWPGDATNNFGQMEDPTNGNALVSTALLANGNINGWTIVRSVSTSFRMTLLLASGDGGNTTHSVTINDGSGAVTSTATPHTADGLHYHVFDIDAGTTDIVFDVNPANRNLTGIAFDNVVVVPEPSSAALLGLGGLALILRRRKG